MKLLRLTVFADKNNVADIELVWLNPEGQVESRHWKEADPQVLRGMSDKLNLVSNDMLRFAPRPDPLKP